MNVLAPRNMTCCVLVAIANIEPGHLPLGEQHLCFLDRDLRRFAQRLPGLFPGGEHIRGPGMGEPLQAGVPEAGREGRRGAFHIRDTPPTIFMPRIACRGRHGLVRETFAKYRETLADDRRVLFDRYRLVDAAIKVVGIGSVGTLCMVALMMSIADHPFFLQVKQANASVLEAYAGKSVYAQHGERVVQGQRLMQPASDLFLGWVIGPEGRHVYIRQLRDVKLSALVETYDAEMLSIYGKACGWALARAHAKAGDPWTISGYLGNGGQFDDAMGQFALAYADQAEKDHAALKAAVRNGIVEVQLEH